MAVIVHKYGGTSIGTPERIRAVADRVVLEASQGDQVVIVVSAMRDTTDELIGLAHTVSRKPREREMDMLLTAGERISMALLAMAVHDRGLDAVSFTGSQSGIITDNRHGTARIIEIRPERIKAALACGRIVIVAGFQGVSREREVTTLGRGGSDTTAVALAAALGTDSCDILTDVDGIYTADPRIVPDARLIRRMTWDTAAIVTALGARVLYSRSVAVARAHRIAMHVRSSFGYEDGTVVGEEDEMEPIGVKAISRIGPIARITVDEAELPRALNRLGEASVELRMIGSRDGGVRSLYVETARMDEAKRALPGASIAGDQFALVTAVGAGLYTDPSAPAAIMEALEKAGVEVFDFVHSPVAITFVVDFQRTTDAVIAAHEAAGLAAAGEW